MHSLAVFARPLGHALRSAEVIARRLRPVLPFFRAAVMPTQPRTPKFLRNRAETSTIVHCVHEEGGL